MTVLRSYVSGMWVSPDADGKPVLDAVTGEEVTRVSSAGIDMGAALSYGRQTGGPELRALTFHQRAALLKQLGLFLREHRPELYELSARTGATLGDSTFDVDGGIGVLLSYASKAKRELPNDTVCVDGPVEPLGRAFDDHLVVGQLALGLARVAEQDADAAVDVELRVVKRRAGPVGELVQFLAVLAQQLAGRLRQLGALVEGQLAQRGAAHLPAVIEGCLEVNAVG